LGEDRVIAHGLLAQGGEIGHGLGRRGLHLSRRRRTLAGDVDGRRHLRRRLSCAILNAGDVGDGRRSRAGVQVMMRIGLRLGLRRRICLGLVRAAVLRERWRRLVGGGGVGRRMRPSETAIDALERVAGVRICRHVAPEGEKKTKKKQQKRRL